VLSGLEEIEETGVIMLMATSMLPRGSDEPLPVVDPSELASIESLL
jgi:hypothetical protein